MTPTTVDDLSEQRLRLTACAQALPTIMDEVRQMGSETWRNLASRTLVALTEQPTAIVEPLCPAGALGVAVPSSERARRAAEVLRGVAAAILVGGQPITILGVRFEGSRAKSHSSPAGLT